MQIPGSPVSVFPIKIARLSDTETKYHISCSAGCSCGKDAFALVVRKEGDGYVAVSFTWDVGNIHAVAVPPHLKEHASPPPMDVVQAALLDGIAISLGGKLKFPDLLAAGLAELKRRCRLNPPTVALTPLFNQPASAAPVEAN
jgi:hypothetical protein